jgi:signal transduction histidine kinase
VVAGRNNGNGNEHRVLLKTVTGKDASMARAVLERAGITACACASVADLVRELGQGAGALLIAEETFSDSGIASLAAALQNQPPWSDIPVLILARTGADSAAIYEAMDRLANLTVIERPLRISALVSSLRSALRARRRQYELRGVLEGLREADQRKTEFLATLAHELRNPLAPLSTALAILLRNGLDAEAARPYYEMMGRQIDHMVRLINDLMEVSRITRGNIELRPELLALDRVVSDAIEVSRPLLDAAKHRLSVDIPEGDWTVRGDAVRLTQVFSNLLNNAAKYTPPGGDVMIRCERREARAAIHVRDNGAGVPADMLDAIFGMFVQVSGSARAVQGGLGIGLTLVKSLVELHGGTVRAHSAGVGKGTDIIVELPLTAAAAPNAPSETQSALDASLRGRILIVDDNRDAADALAILLNDMGAVARVAYNGAAALEAAAELRPTVAILDIGMPGMDGCELAVQLRSVPENAGLTLIALTGWGQSGDRARIAAAGFHHHFLKPIELDQLVKVLRGGPSRPG